MSTPYERIRDFCKNKDIPKLKQDLMVSRFYENFDLMVTEYRTKEGKEPTDETSDAYEDALLSDVNLQNILKLVDEEIENEFADRTKRVKRQTSFKEFSLSVLSGVIASFLFTILLVIILNLAQSQIKSWISDWYTTDKQIQQITDELQ